MKKLAFLMALLLVCSLCGCQSGLSEGGTASLSPEDTLTEALQALTVGSSTGHAVLLGADGTPAVPHNSGIALLLSGCVQYDIREFSAEENSATALVDITAPDAPALLLEATEAIDATDSQALAAWMEEALRGDYPTSEHTVTVQLVKAEGQWCVVTDFALSNALTGGLAQEYLQLQQQILGQLQEGGDRA